jgi:glyoxylase I family protein
MTNTLHAFHHVAIIVSDYLRSKQFYTEVLGFSVLAEHYRAERQSFKLDLAGPGNMRLEIFSFPSSPSRVSQPEACGLRHLAFWTPNLDQSIERLSSFGVRLEPIRIDEYTGKRFTFFADPDGLPLELYEE